MEYIETIELCSYGCGHVAKYKFKNGKLCCSNHFSKCPVNRRKNSESGKGRIIPKTIPIKTTKLCSYGCRQQAKYKLKNGNLCCSDYFSKCPINRKITSKRLKGSKYLKPISIKTFMLCSYGCGQIAKYKLKNGKLCCGNNISQCPITRKKISERHKGKRKLTIQQIKDRYPTFYKEEDLRYNPDKPNKKEIQVRCKYNECKNSKEQNGWFTPIKNQLSERINCLEKPWGNDGGFFYCSDECKENCPLFRFNSNYYLNSKNSELLYTSEEINIWRQEVLKRQREEYNINYNFCEKCEVITDLQVHHEKPQKLYPGMILDPDNGIILCKKCHYKYGHKTGTPCSTGNLAKKKPCN